MHAACALHAKRMHLRARVPAREAETELEEEVLFFPLAPKERSVHYDHRASAF